MSEIYEDFFLKIIVVGDSKVGKTSLIYNYCYGKSFKNIYPTIGCDFCNVLKENYKGFDVRLQFWDIEGYFFIY